MTAKAESTEIESELETISDSLNAEVEITASGLEVISEMRKIDGDRRGKELLISGSEKVSQWESYRQALTNGLEDDEAYEISNDEIDDLYIILGEAQYDRATRILDEYTEGVLT